MELQQNPFDRDSHNIPLMRFLLHSNSLASEILSKESPVNRLVKLNRLKEIEIIPLPTANNNLRKRFADNGLVFTEYFSHESRVVLKASDGSIHDVISPFTNRLPEKFWEQVICNSKVTLADIFASDICDYLVVGVSDPVLAVKVARDNIITAERALELVRIILTAHGRFYISPEELVNELFYYLYRSMKLFKEFHHASTVIAYAHGEGLSEKVYDYVASLRGRLDFICRAYDKVAFFSLKTTNFDTQDNQLYHLAYFVMLITGVFDDLAHIIEEFYHMTIKGRKNISLRIPPDEKPNKFYQLLQSENAALYEFLTALDTQRDINAFYPIRDSLQHREWLKGIQFSDGSEDNKNIFELSNEAAESLRMASGASTCIVNLHKPCLDPLLFITWAQKVLIGLVNGVLSSIDWDSVCKTLLVDIQSKIHESNQGFERGVGYLLGWPTEPLYF